MVYFIQFVWKPIENLSTVHLDVHAKEKHLTNIRLFILNKISFALQIDEFGLFICLRHSKNKI